MIHIFNFIVVCMEVAQIKKESNNEKLSVKCSFFFLLSFTYCKLQSKDGQKCTAPIYYSCLNYHTKLNKIKSLVHKTNLINKTNVE